MGRRKVLATISSLVALSGCVSIPNGSPENESATTTDECGDFQMCNGSTIVEVFVSAYFSGEVVLTVGCRDEDFEIQPGETKTLTRQSHGETCEIALYIDSDKAYHANIQDYVSTKIDVVSNGEINVETIEV